jgi:hypothetical protein
MTPWFIAWQIVTAVVVVLYPLAWMAGGAALTAMSVVWAVVLTLQPLAIAALFRPSAEEVGPEDHGAWTRIRRSWRVLVVGTLVLLAANGALTAISPAWGGMTVFGILALGFFGAWPYLAAKYPACARPYPADLSARTASLRPRRLNDVIPRSWWGIPWAVWLAGLACFLWRMQTDAFLWRLMLGLHAYFGLLMLCNPPLMAWCIRAEAEPLGGKAASELLREYESLRRFRYRGMFFGMVVMTVLFTSMFVLMGCKLVESGKSGAWWGVIGGAVGSLLGIVGGVFGAFCGAWRIRLADRLRKAAMLMLVVPFVVNGRALAEDVRKLDNSVTLIYADLSVKDIAPGGVKELPEAKAK